jgi:16S rRNA C967 or C1407 C5-methylase (RsmB/RsmF family)/NOL1/NOP2/fmu family ribosome biogenesis protein
MIPEEFIKRIQTQKFIDAEALVHALEDPSPVSIRVNPAKWNKRPTGSEQVPWCDKGFYLKSRPSYTLDPLFHSGCYYPQEASGMFLEKVIRQIDGSPENCRVLDLCAAPGGKSTHLSGIIGPDSLLISNDAIRQRSLILEETVMKWGSGNILVTQNDASAFGRLSGFFDIIVVDAPCSGEGMFRSEIARNEWSVGNTLHCAERQKRILMDVWPSLKENGVLVYSTCTFNPGENELNMKWFTRRHEAETLTLDISAYKNITAINCQGAHGYGFFPGRIRGEGFFISILRKKERPRETNFKARLCNENRITRKEKAIVAEWTHFPADNVVKLGNEVIVPACSCDDYQALSGILRIIKAGTGICTVKADKYLPLHDAAMSVYFNKESFPAVSVSLDQALSYLSRGGIRHDNVQKGWNIVSYNGVSLGFINNIGSRINNYYPIDWHIRMRKPEQGKENIISWKGYDDK